MINLLQSNTDDYQYILDSLGQTVQINNQQVKAVIANSTLSIDVDDKKISTLTPITRGDIVHYNNGDWIVLSQVNGQRNGRYRAYMRVSDYMIKFNFQGDVKQFPSIVDGKVFDVETGQYMTLPASKILVSMQENEDTLQITVGQRFIKMGKAWAVEALDRTEKGLLRLWCKQDQFNDATDDRENEIADAKKWVYVVDITNTETTIQKDNTLQLTVSVSLNGQVVNNKTVLYSTSDSDIATVDANGLITAINIGSVTVTAQLADNPIVHDTISLTVEEMPKDNYALAINGDTSVTKGYSKTWTASLTNNGQPVAMKPATWLVTSTSGGTTNLATITSQTSESVTVKGDNLGYVKLVCQLNDGSLSAEKQIQVKSLI